MSNAKIDNIVTGYTIPDDLLTVLKRYGMPDFCISFSISCGACDAPLEFEYKSYQVTSGTPILIAPEITRVYKLVLVE